MYIFECQMLPKFTTRMLQSGCNVMLNTDHAEAE